MKIFGREPTLWISVITGLVILAGTAGLHWLTGQQAGLIAGAIIALAGAANAFAVRPIAPAAFTYAIAALLAVAGSYGLNFSPETVGALNAIVLPALALITRGQVTPAADPAPTTGGAG